MLTDGNSVGGETDGEIKIWNPMTGLLFRSFKVREDGELDYLKVLSNGCIGKIGDDYEVEIWDPWTGTLVTKFGDHVADFEEVTGGKIVTICIENDDKSPFQIWDQSTGASLRTLPLEIEGDDILLAFGNIFANGSFVVGSREIGEIQIVDITSGVTIRPINCDPFDCLKVLSDGTMASSHKNGEIRLWNITNEALIRTIRTKHDDVEFFVELTEGVVAYTYKDQIEIWDTRKGL